jgi:hypothetical protein
MGLQQAVGAQLHISAALPATHDDTGFAALTYTKVGKLSSLPDLDGEYDTATFDNLETGEEEKFPDVFRAGDGVFTVGLDDSDTGQDLIETSKDAKTKCSFKFTLKDGTVYYRIGFFRSYKPTGIEVGGVVMAECSVEFEKSTVKVSV